MGMNLARYLPIDISAHGHQVDRLINIVHVFMVVLFVGWGIYLIYCLLRFREREGHQADISPRQFKVPTYIEIGIVLIEAGLLIFVSAPVWSNYKNEFPSEGEALTVRVVARQFQWLIQYPGKDGRLGRLDPAKVDEYNMIGLDSGDPDAKDDVVSTNGLYIPVNKPVIVKLSSLDVIHSFSIPVMRVKQDAIPGMEIPIHFKAIQTGEHEIACAQLCGNGHYSMKGQFTVQTEPEFNAWLEEEYKNLTSESSAGEGTTNE